MRDLAKLAGRVSQARESVNGDGTPRTWLHDALSELSDRSAEAAKQIRKNPDGRRRALLLTAAMLEGAPTDAVFGAEQLLLEAVDYPAADKHAFNDQDFAERLAAVQIEVDARGRVKFPTQGYGNALRNHFWRNFPGFREHFGVWTARVVGSASVAVPDKIYFVERFTEQALAVDRVDDVLEMASTWTDDTTAGPETVSLAELVLQQALENERHGRTFRQQLLAWARQPASSVGLAMTVARLSQNVLALTYPDQALVRLRHLTRHNDSAVRTAATDALLTLTREHRLWRRLLYRLCGNPKYPDMHRRDRALFLKMTSPRALVEVQGEYPSLITNRQVRQQLTTGWRALLKDPEGVAVEDAIRQWLDAHTVNPALAGLLDVLVDACSTQPMLLGRLFAVSLDWLRTTTGLAEHAARDRTAAGLRVRIDRAQGLDFINATVSTEETTR